MKPFSETAGVTRQPPTVSVIVPVHNGARFLRECIDTILAQDYTNLEILIADDGSTDDSLEIIENLSARDPRIRWWKNPRNLGQTANHNFCLHEARGEFIKFVHQDDKFLDASAITQLANALRDHPQASLAGSASMVIDEQSRLKERRAFFRPGVWNGHEIIRANMEDIGNRIGEPSVVMFRRAQAIRGFQDGYKQLWDLEMWFYLLEQGDLVWLGEPLSAFRQHPAQQSNINRRNDVGQLEIWQLMRIYYAKPWLRAIATQRMLVNHARFLKRNRARLDERADVLLPEIKKMIHPASYPLCWLERKTIHQISKLKKLVPPKPAKEKDMP
jgi:glycosyltransferase involved in cell wall biosynthesis